MKNIFQRDITTEVISRIDKLTPTSKQLWGKMSVSQMMAHCCVPYELVYENNHSKPNGFKRFMLKLFVKDAVVSEKPYKRNGQTAPEFIIKGDRDFEIEKSRLVNYLNRTQGYGESFFENKESHSFGHLTKNEWNNMFYKHIDHHLKQFGV